MKKTRRAIEETMSKNVPASERTFVRMLVRHVIPVNVLVEAVRVCSQPFSSFRQQEAH